MREIDREEGEGFGLTEYIICRSYSGELKIQESEVSELKFFPLSDIPENLSPPVIKALKTYLRYRRHNHKERG